MIQNKIIIQAMYEKFGRNSCFILYKQFEYFWYLFYQQFLFTNYNNNTDDQLIF